MKKKILFVNDEMCLGGVSKVLLNLIDALDKDKYDISLLILHKHGEMLDKIPDYVHVIGGSKFFEVCDVTPKECLKQGKLIKKVLFNSYLRSGAITKLIRQERKQMGLATYDVEIAFKDGICSIFTSVSDAPIKINWIHSDYSIRNYAGNCMTTFKRILKNFTYHVAVSKVAADSFKNVFDLDEVKVVHNIIDVDTILNKSKEDIKYRDDRLTFVCVGRMHPQKAYPRLLEVMHRLKEDGIKDYAVYVLGDGTEKDTIIKMKDDYKLDNLYLLGNKDNPYPYIKEADCLLLTSIYEGLPTVVYEALILHTPVLSTKVAGVDEQLKDKYGIIIDNNDDSIYSSLKSIIEDRHILDKYKENVSNYTYENKEIISSIERLFNGQA